MFDQNNNKDFKNLQNILNKKVMSEAMNKPLSQQQRDAILSILFGKNSGQASTSAPTTSTSSTTKTPTTPTSPVVNPGRIKPLSPEEMDRLNKDPAYRERMTKLKDELKAGYMDYKSRNPSTPKYM